MATAVIQRGFYPKTERESTLSDILQTPQEIGEEFFLSKTARARAPNGIRQGVATKGSNFTDSRRPGSARTITAPGIVVKMGSTDPKIVRAGRLSEMMKDLRIRDRRMKALVYLHEDTVKKI